MLHVRPLHHGLMPKLCACSKMMLASLDIQDRLEKYAFRVKAAASMPHISSVGFPGKRERGEGQPGRQTLHPLPLLFTSPPPPSAQNMKMACSHSEDMIQSMAVC